MNDKTKIIYCGDTNIDILIVNQSLQITEYLNMMSEYSFISYINCFTRETNTSKLCID